MDGCFIVGFSAVLLFGQIHCPQSGVVPDAARFCQSMAAPIRYSRTDMPETRRQLRALNATWRATCEPAAAGR